MVSACLSKVLSQIHQTAEQLTNDRCGVSARGDFRMRGGRQRMDKQIGRQAEGPVPGQEEGGSGQMDVTW